MLKVRLIPTLLLLRGRMIKTVGFDHYRDVGDPVKTAKVYDAQGVDELIFLDITASQEGRQTLFDVVTQAAEEVFMPFTVGGGVQSMSDIETLLYIGADKVSINSAAVERPSFVQEAVRRYGGQCVVASIDVRRQPSGAYEVFTHRGTKATGLEVLDWAQQVVELGVGEILLTNIERDGTMEGYDLELIQQVAEAVPIPLIASSGAGSLQDLVDGITIGKASAVAAASIFHFTDQNPIKARAFMKRSGLEVKKG